MHSMPRCLQLPSAACILFSQAQLVFHSCKLNRLNTFKREFSRLGLLLMYMREAS